MIYATPDQIIRSELDGGASGLASTLRFYYRSGGVNTFPSSGTITEDPAGSGLYEITAPTPSTPGTYERLWDTGPGTTAYRDDDDLVVSASGAAPGTWRDRLARMTAASSTPVLTAADLDELLQDARRCDAEGVAPNETGWTPTYDLNAAAGAGWRIKEGLVAGTQVRGSFEGDFDSTDFRGFAFARKAAYFEKKAIGSISISAP